MVAKITTGQSIRGMLHYNENKVDKGQAKLILSSGFAGEISKMNINQKLQRFQHLTELKPNVKTNAIHISLNFHSGDKLDHSKLQQIANDYMERIGFGDQPFLVYRHDDAAHLHLHITTTNITAEGRRIDLHDIGKLVSEPARKAIEGEYGLIRAEDQDQKKEATIKIAEPEKAHYGKSLTKEAINNVVTAVFRDYKFTSLAEYNAVLQCFNVIAIRGAEHTAMFEKKGLMYSLLDKSGKQVGVPIKSSAIYSKPTLLNLEKKFEINLEKRKAEKDQLKKQIDQLIAGGSLSNKAFQKAAAKLGIHVMFRANDQGLVFGLTFVDHRNKVVFNGSDLGKAYTAKAITEKLKGKSPEIKIVPQVRSKSGRAVKHTKHKTAQSFDNTPIIHKVLDIALAKTTGEGGLKIPRRKKRRRKNQIITQEINL